jgi:hypothetical protein
MLMARPVPVTLSSENETEIAREGYVSVIAIPRTESGFDKERKISVKLRAKQIGQLLAWRGLLPTNGVVRNNGNAHLSVMAYSGGSPVSLEFKPVAGETEPMVEVNIAPKAEGVLPVTMAISVGEMKAFQVLLEAALPGLYGWTFKNFAPKTAQTASQTVKSPEEFFKQFSG